MKKIKVRVIRLSEIKPYGPLQGMLDKFEKKITLLENQDGRYKKRLNGGLV